VLWPWCRFRRAVGCDGALRSAPASADDSRVPCSHNGSFYGGTTDRLQRPGSVSVSFNGTRPNAPHPCSHPPSFQYQPINVVSLRGASLIDLQGGQRKRDLKRAFALTDSAGTIHFIIAGIDRDYCDWVQQL